MVSREILLWRDTREFSHLLVHDGKRPRKVWDCLSLRMDGAQWLWAGERLFTVFHVVFFKILSYIDITMVSNIT